MLKYSLCLEPILEEIEFYDRIKIAADLGFDAVEFWNPGVYDVRKIGKTAADNKIKIAACTLNDPWKYRMNMNSDLVNENVKKSFEIGRELGCDTFICLAGDSESKVDSQKNILIENLKRVAELATKENMHLVLEPLNSLIDHKGYYLDSSYIGFEIIKCVDCPNIKILFDIYHMQIMEGNIIGNITKNIANIGHFHSAGVPGRHEHFLGENEYKNIQKAIAQVGYDRYFGLEYWPTYNNVQSLEDVLKYLKG